MIYGRTGETLRIRRYAKLADVKALDNREPDRQDRQALKSKSYVVTENEYREVRLYHLAFLRADRGSLEITEALDALTDEIIDNVSK